MKKDETKMIPIWNNHMNPILSESQLDKQPFIFRESDCWQNANGNTFEVEFIIVKKNIKI